MNFFVWRPLKFDLYLTCNADFKFLGFLVEEENKCQEFACFYENPY